MNVACNVCRRNMNLLQSQKLTSNRHRSEYFCIDCAISITIHDEPSENIQAIRELQLKIREFESNIQSDDIETDFPDFAHDFSNKEDYQTVLWILWLGQTFGAKQRAHTKDNT